MRIGIDACCWSNPRGFGRFTRELVNRLILDYGRQHEFVLLADEATGLDMPAFSDAVIETIRTRRRPIEEASADGWRSPVDLMRFGMRAFHCRLDVFLFPTVYTYFPIPGRVPVVVTFHDAMTEFYPDLFFPSKRAHLFWRAKTGLARRRAAAIVTPSQNARADIAQAMKIPIDSIRCVGEAASAEFNVCNDPVILKEVLERYGVPDLVPLVLYVGGISPHKNLAGLLRAMSQISQEDSNWHLVLVGEYARDSFLSCYQEVYNLCQELQLANRVTFTGFIPDTDLVTLYNGATVFVLPSLDEGFGLPVVEAMACGLPVAASHRGSIPEVLGDAGLTFDPEDTTAMACTIARLLNDADLRKELGRRGLARAANFSWKATAREMMSVLESFTPNQEPVRS